MSCYWDILCVDCDEPAGIDGANHCDDLMSELIRYADTLANLKRSNIIYDLTLQANFIHVPVEFFVRHQGHHLRPIDEYSRFDTPCQTTFYCDACMATVKCEQREHTRRDPRDHYHTKDNAYHYLKALSKKPVTQP